MNTAIRNYWAEIIQTTFGWYWHLKAPNGKIVACAGEEYQSRAHCRRMVRKLFPDVVVKEGK